MQKDHSSLFVLLSVNQRKKADKAMAPHLFIVVQSPPEQGLEIPSAFTRKFRGDLRETVLLKVPTGASWKVELVRSENVTRLQNGWQEFAEFYSIKKLYVLEFRYEWNSEFHVTIFNSSVREIEYRLGGGTDDKMEDVPIEISDEFSENQGSKAKTSQQEMADTSVEIIQMEDVPIDVSDNSSENQGSKAKRSQQETADVSVEILHDDFPVTKPRMNTSSRKFISEINQTKKMKLSESCERTQRRLKSPIYAKDEFTSYQRAKAFRSEKAFFISFMHRSYVSNPFTLAIPLGFVKYHLSCTRKYCKLNLNVGEEQQTWAVMCRLYGASATIMRDGWKKFVHENSLKLGNVCVFELESCDGNVFNVIIYRADEEA